MFHVKLIDFLNNAILVVTERRHGIFFVMDIFAYSEISDLR